MSAPVDLNHIMQNPTVQKNMEMFQKMAHRYAQTKGRVGAEEERAAEFRNMAGAILEAAGLTVAENREALGGMARDPAADDRADYAEAISALTAALYKFSEGKNLESKRFVTAQMKGLTAMLNGAGQPAVAGPQAAGSAVIPRPGAKTSENETEDEDEDECMPLVEARPIKTDEAGPSGMAVAVAVAIPAPAPAPAGGMAGAGPANDDDDEDAVVYVPPPPPVVVDLLDD